MLNVSPDIEQEIQKRVANGDFSSADDLLRNAMHALDESLEAERAWLEQELLKGYEGEDVEMTPEEWTDIRREAANNAKLRQKQ